LGVYLGPVSISGRPLPFSSVSLANHFFSRPLPIFALHFANAIKTVSSTPESTKAFVLAKVRTAQGFQFRMSTVRYRIVDHIMRHISVVNGKTTIRAKKPFRTELFVAYHLELFA